MTRQQEIILSCMKQNLADAKTKGMREFCTKQIEDYQARINKANRPKPKAPKAFTSFLDKL